MKGIQTKGQPGTATRAECKRVIRGFEIKEVNDADRTFSGTAAAFTLDQGGDVILPGAFKRTLADWRRSKGKKIPLIDSHNYGTVVSVIGHMTEAAENADGLEATFQLMSDDPHADAVYRRVKGGFVNGLSIGYETVESRNPTDEERRKGIWRYLKEVKLRENSVVIFPMNVDATIDAGSVKSFLASLRADGIRDADRAELKVLHEEISALLGSAPSDDPLAPDMGELAPDDPKRLELESIYRGILMRTVRA